MDNEYGTMFKRLMNERNELRKYIIDICKLLDIDTNQSVLGANCLEFYAVLCSTVENKIKDLQEQLKRKEQECRELRKQLEQAMYLSEGTLRLYANRQNIKYKQAIDKIEKYCKECNLKFDYTACAILGFINEARDCK